VEPHSSRGLAGLRIRVGGTIGENLIDRGHPRGNEGGELRSEERKRAMATAKMRKWWTLGCVVPPLVCIAVCGCLFAYVAIVHGRLTHWYESVEDRLLALAERRPEEIPPAEWAFCLLYTWNLHTNHGPGFESSQRDRFLAEFDKRLKGRVDLSTIDWIWDEYVAHSKGGAHYSQMCRPTSAMVHREFLEAEPGKFQLQPWLDDLRERRARRRR